MDIPTFIPPSPNKKARASGQEGGRCGATGIRTPDLLHAMQALYQLSYSPGVLILDCPSYETFPAPVN